MPDFNRPMLLDGQDVRSQTTWINFWATSEHDIYLDGRCSCSQLPPNTAAFSVWSPDCLIGTCCSRAWQYCVAVLVWLNFEPYEESYPSLPPQPPSFRTSCTLQEGLDEAAKQAAAVLASA